jgi:hypothetical protein
MRACWTSLPLLFTVVVATCSSDDGVCGGAGKSRVGDKELGDMGLGEIPLRPARIKNSPMTAPRCIDSPYSCAMPCCRV